MALRRRPEKTGYEDKGTASDANIQQIEARLDNFDRRLDNIDSMVSAVAERVMSRPVIMIVTCPHCGKNMEINLIGSQKPTT